MASAPAGFEVDGARRSEVDIALGLGHRRDVRLAFARNGKPEIVFDPPIDTEEHPVFHGMRAGIAESYVRGAILPRVVGPNLNPDGSVKRIKKGRDAGQSIFLLRSWRSRGSFLSRTSKMSAPSWSIPAGSPKIGGSCPSATAMVNVDDVDPRARANAVRQLSRFIGTPLRQSVAKSGGPQLKRYKVVLPGKSRRTSVGRPLPVLDYASDFICDWCYAGRGGYANVSTQVYQMGRFYWMRRELAWNGFVPQMVSAIRANARLRPSTPTYDTSYFRIHDSGDFHSEEAIEAWGEVCRRTPEILYWAPTRVWPFPRLLAALQREVARTPNLIVRPSALHVGDAPPGIVGLPGGSTSHPDGKPVPGGRYRRRTGSGTWVCPVYDEEGGKKNCGSVKNPLGSRICRLCWGEHIDFYIGDGAQPFRDTPVTYTLH